MSWTENKWLKPAWMGENHDFVNKYQDKFAQIGQKFAPKIITKKKDDGPNGIRLSGAESDIKKMVSIFKYAFEDDISFNKNYGIIFNEKWKAIQFGNEKDRNLDKYHKEYIKTDSHFYPNQQVFFNIKRGIRGYIDKFATGELKIDDLENITNGDGMSSEGKRIYTLLTLVHAIAERFAIENYEDTKKKYNADKYTAEELEGAVSNKNTELDNLRNLYQPAHRYVAIPAEIYCLKKIFKEKKWGEVYEKRVDKIIDSSASTVEIFNDIFLYIDFTDIEKLTMVRYADNFVVLIYSFFDGSSSSCVYLDV